MWWHRDWWGIGGVIMTLWMLLFWAILIGGLYLLVRAIVRYGATHPVTPPGAETPRAILDRRLAAGEITPDEYDALRRKIEGG